MQTIEDCFGVAVRLTAERVAHILEHPEMKEMGAEIERVLAAPQIVRRSRSDDAVRLFYAFYRETIVAAKWLCGCKIRKQRCLRHHRLPDLTDKPKLGAPLWPIS